MYLFNQPENSKCVVGKKKFNSDYSPDILTLKLLNYEFLGFYKSHTKFRFLRVILTSQFTDMGRALLYRCRYPLSST